MLYELTVGFGPQLGYIAFRLQPLGVLVSE